MRALANVPRPVAFALPNLSSVSVAPCEPWAFRGDIPENVRADKNARTLWISKEKPAHCVYSLLEGINSSARIRKPKDGDEGNPPHAIHGLAADFDGRSWSDDEIERACQESPFRPSAYEKTLSGYVRFLWIFEKPVTVTNWDMATALLEKGLKEVRAASLLPGLDKGSWDPGRYYTNSCEWYDLEGPPIPSAIVQGWLFEVVQSSKTMEADVTIPLPEVAAELAKKYPRFQEWTEPFEIGSQGPSFFVEGSLSPKSAIIKPGGIFTFSDHSTVPFWSWERLLGSSFVAKYKNERTGGIIDNVFYDVSCGKWLFPTPVGDWVSLDTSSVERQLRARGASNLPPPKDKGGLTEVQRMLAHVQLHANVAGSGPFVYHPVGPIHHDGKRFLNTCSARVVAPVLEPQEWGPNGGFPFICEVFESLFPADALDHFIGWFAVAYRSGYEQKPSPGQASVLSSSPSSGKTFLALRVVGPTLGGIIDATRFALGEDSFSAPYLEVPVWLLDDMKPPATDAEHRAYTHRIKSFVSSHAFVSNAKFRGQVSVSWLGRLLVCINDDDASREALPSPTASNADKLNFYQLRTPAFKVFSENRAENDERAARELPFLARYLLDYKIPEKFRTKPQTFLRMGLDSFHNQTLLEAAEQNDEASTVLELVHRWRNIYFSQNPTAACWKGTTTELIRELASNEEAGSSLVSRLVPRRVSIFLRSLAALGNTFIKPPTTQDKVRIWVIDRPDSIPLVPETEERTPERPKRVSTFVPSK